MEKLWVDRYRPQTISKLSFHTDLSGLLHQLSKRDDFPHLVFYGPDGSGKKTRAMCFLESVFGSGVHKLKSETRSFKVQNTSTQVEYNLLSSNHHLDITPSNSQRQDRHVINKVIKETGSMASIEKGGKKYRVIIINEADKLTREAQASLRRTMEKYSQNCRIILLCQHLHKLIVPIRSRCLNIKVKPPTTNEITAILKSALEDSNTTLDDLQIHQIAQNSQNNLRKALLSLQLASTIRNSKKPIIDNWKEDAKRMVKIMTKQQSAQSYKLLQDMLYQLLINCIEEGLILKAIIEELVADKEVTEKALFEIVHRAAETEKTMCQGDKPIYHLLAFAARCMAILQQSK